MPVTENVEEFMLAVDQFMSMSPDSTRVCMKYRHCDSLLAIKVTDDSRVVQYKTENLQDVKKVEKMASQTIRSMASK